MELLEICKNAKNISGEVGILDTNRKNAALRAPADALVANAAYLLEEN